MAWNKIIVKLNKIKSWNNIIMKQFTGNILNEKLLGNINGNEIYIEIGKYDNEKRAVERKIQ